jgi:aspartyl/glutamyl-tRNA(Asn/Gln) amidotransferase C subunit
MNSAPRGSLARLSLSDEEVERLQGEMSGMIAFAEKLLELDVSGVQPTTHAFPMQNVLPRGRGQPFGQGRDKSRARPGTTEPVLSCPGSWSKEAGMDIRDLTVLELSQSSLQRTVLR